MIRPGINYVKTQKHVISHDVMALSANQRKLLTVLSKTQTREIQSARFISPLKLSASSAQQSVDILMKKDFVDRSAQGIYRVLDLAMKYYLNVILWV